MIWLRAVLWLLLAGVLVFLLMRTPGVRLYDAIARRLRGRRAGRAPDPAPARRAAGPTLVVGPTGMTHEMT